MSEFVEDTIEAIKASDLLLLMDVVKEATGLYNAVERGDREIDWLTPEFDALGDALRALGLNEVTPE